MDMKIILIAFLIVIFSVMGAAFFLIKKYATKERLREVMAAKAAQQPPIKRKRSSKTPLLVLSGIFGIIGLVLSYFSATNVLEAVKSVSWPMTEGVVIASEVDRRRDKKFTRPGESGTHANIHYTANISYEYSVGKVTYLSNKVTFGLQAHDSRSYAYGLKSKYPKGMKVKVFYNPDKPHQAVLERGISFSSYIFLFMGIGLIVMSGIVYLIANSSSKALRKQIDDAS